MANLVETARWEAGIYQWETSDPVQGGPNGIDNRPTRELANRTLWLRNELAQAVQSIGSNKTAADQALALKADAATVFTAGAGLTGGGSLGGARSFALATPSKLNGSTTNWAGNGATGHTHEIDKATPTLAGVVKLVNTLDSAAADAALSAAMGKKLQDEKLNISGDQTVDGTLTAGRAAIWGKLRFPVKAANAHWVLEANPDAALANRESLMFNIKFEQNGQSRYIRFPYLGAESQNVAYESWVTSYIGGYVGSYVQKSDAVNLDDGSKLATARAVKIVNDKAERATPPGAVAYFGGQNAPAGWLKANGAAVSRTTYAALFAAIGTTYGAGDGRTTFNLPDLRGEFVRGWDDGRNIDRGRALGSRQDDAFQGHARNLKRSESDARMHGINYMQNVNVNNSPLSPAPAAVNTGDNWLTEDYLPHLSYGTPRVAAETRPRNIALLACIKI